MIALRSHALIRALAATSLACLVLSARAQAREPVIDMHFHIEAADAEGPPPLTICAPYPSWPGQDPAAGEDAYVARLFGNPERPRKFVSARDDDDLRLRSIAMLEKHDVYALGGGSPERVARWRQDAPDLSREQKRAILYDNAARFLRIDPAAQTN